MCTPESMPLEHVSVGQETEVVEQRLKSLQSQLQTEFLILDRLLYKNKNQHRRCSYFQFLLKVRRDLKLLRSVKLGEILNFCFLVIHEKRPEQQVQLLENLKRKSCNGCDKPNFFERLLGVAHLLSQMVEPMLKAATEISRLLAQWFFMEFSRSVLALLGRIRVLIQQMLLDVVYVFNCACCLSQKVHAVHLTKQAIQVSREYCPMKRGSFILLKCVWQRDKYVLVETKTG